MKKLQPLILPLVPEDKELLTEKGYFYIQMRPNWTYTEETEMMEERLKSIKKDEVAKGIATAEYSPTLYYKSGRPEPRE